MPSSTSNSNRGRARRFAVAAASVVTFVATLEVATRLEQYWKHGAPLFGLYTYDSALLDVDEHGITGRPHGAYDKWVLNTHGFRGPEVSLEKTPGTLRVVTLGASETFGLFELPDNEWPRQLERELESAGVNAEVINASIAGMGLPERVRHYQHRVARFEPDILLLMLEYATYAGMTPARRRAMEERTVRLPWRRDDGGPGVLTGITTLRFPQQVWVTISRYLPGWVQSLKVEYNLFRIRRRFRARFQQYQSVVSPELDFFALDLERVIELARLHDTRVIFLAPAAWPSARNKKLFLSSFPTVHEDWMAEAVPRMNQIARELAEREAMDFSDLNQLVQGQEADLMRDYGHYSDSGSAVAARHVADLIRAGSDNGASRMLTR